MAANPVQTKRASTKNGTLVQDLSKGKTTAVTRGRATPPAGGYRGKPRTPDQIAAAQAARARLEPARAAAPSVREDFAARATADDEKVSSALSAGTPKEIAAATGLAEADVRRSLRRLALKGSVSLTLDRGRVTSAAAAPLEVSVEETPPRLH